MFLFFYLIKKNNVLGTEDELGESSGFRERKDKDGGVERSGVRETEAHHPPIPAKVCECLWVRTPGSFSFLRSLLRSPGISLQMESY